MRFLLLTILILQALYSQASVTRQECIDYCLKEKPKIKGKKAVCRFASSYASELSEELQKQYDEVCQECCEPEIQTYWSLSDLACKENHVGPVSMCPLKEFPKSIEYLKNPWSGEKKAKKMKRRRRRVSRRRISRRRRQ